MARRFRFVVLAYILALTLALLTDYTVAADRNCYQCSGINCQRTTYTKKVTCPDPLDSCVSIFDGQITEIQGCLEELPAELRNICKTASNKESKNVASINRFECQICNGDLCNNLGANDSTCVQCDSKTDPKCQNNPEEITPTRCPISKTSNSYCFARINNDEHTQRGCFITQSEQRSCLDDVNCLLCLPSELNDCNAIQISNTAENNGGTSGGNDNQTDGGESAGNNNSNSTNSGSDNQSGNSNSDTNTENGENSDPSTNTPSNTNSICHQCNGINCQRTTYAKTVTCADPLDSCVSVFDGQVTEIQGCLEELPVELRNICKTGAVTAKYKDSASINKFDCHICNGYLCNNLGASDFTCVQCDSKTDAKCRNSPEALTPTRCTISKTTNSYCFARIDNDEHTQRGCSITQSEQRSCLGDVNCVLCMPSEISDCNAIRISNIEDDNGGSNNDNDNQTNSGGSASTNDSDSNGNESTTSNNNGANNESGNSNNDTNSSGTDTNGNIIATTPTSESGETESSSNGNDGNTTENGGESSSGGNVTETDTDTTDTEEDSGNATVKTIVSLKTLIIIGICILMSHL